MYAIENNNDFFALAESAKIFRKTAKENPNPLPHLYKNMGIAFSRLNRHKVCGMRRGSS